MAAPSDAALTVHQAKETLDVAFEISRLLDTGLDRETLSILIALVESGIHPDALASVVKELRREAAELKAAEAAAGALGGTLTTQASEGEPSLERM